MTTGETTTIFSGHKAPVTHLACDTNGHRLASEAKASKAKSFRALEARAEA